MKQLSILSWRCIFVWEHSYAFCVLSGSNGRSRSEMSKGWVLPWGALAAPTLVWGRAAIAGAIARYSKPGLLPGSVAFTTLSGRRPWPEGLEQEPWGIWASFWASFCPSLSWLGAQGLSAVLLSWFHFSPDMCALVREGVRSGRARAALLGWFCSFLGGSGNDSPCCGQRQGQALVA